MSCSAIGVGGTGARCVEALVHLCAAGLGPKELFVLLVDPDSANGNLDRTRRTILKYCDCRDALSQPGPGEVSSFSTRIRFGKENESESMTWSPMDAKKTRHLGDLFSYEEYPDWRDLNRLFYSELELKHLVWDKGFRGHASVGAPAMAIVRDRMDRPPWSDLASFIQTSLATGSHKTFIFASAFGATGAGAFPTIPRILRNVAFKKKWGGRERYGIGGALLLPYIIFETPHDEKQEHAQAKHFPMNTQAALLHYRRVWAEGSPFDSVYFLGAREPDLIDRSEVGGKFALGARDQRNPAHFVEFLAGLAALDFFSKDAKYDPVDDTRRHCSAFTAAGSDSKSVRWMDIPDLNGDLPTGHTPRVKEKLTSYLTALAGFIDFFDPLVKDNNFEDRRRFVAWYYRNFRPESLTKSEVITGAEKLSVFARDFVFPWFLQLHRTSVNLSVSLIDEEFLTARATIGNARPGAVTGMNFSRLLHSTAGPVRSGSKLDDGYTAIWDHMCAQPRGSAPSAPLGKLWIMLSLAAADYAEKRYQFTIRTPKSGDES